MSVDNSTTTDSTSTPPSSSSAPLSRLNSDTSSSLTAVTDISPPRKLPSSRFKGVVPQPNGRWGAQIYEKHQRVWLGTFNEEQQAASAYDTAAHRFRGRDAVTNFPISTNEIESAFLNSHSKSEIVDMLRKHTYADELAQSRRIYNTTTTTTSSTAVSAAGQSKVREHLFEKSVTPSDVGKLNRLVIPKQHAEKHFPLNNNNGGDSSAPAPAKGILLNFEDVGGKVWRFRYSYWNSSQSYVLTKGWSRFVKEKELRAGDVVRFERSTGPDGQLYIDCKTRTGPGQATTALLRLFGVDIVSDMGDGGGDGDGDRQGGDRDRDGSCCGGGKRISREIEVWGFGKKQRVIDAL